MTARDDAIREVLGRVPSKRYKPATVLGQMAELYPGHMHNIGDHIAQRMEEAGGSEYCPAGRKLAISMEAELLALRNILLSRVLDTGIIDDQGDEHKHLRTVLRLTDQISRLANIIGLEPPEQSKQAPININEAWAKALPTDATDPATCKCPDGCGCKGNSTEAK